MTRLPKLLAALAALAVLALARLALLHTGLARMAFFELFAYVKGVDILGPTVVREPPIDSPYERWLESARAEIPVFEGLVIEDVASIALRPWPQMGAGVTGLYLRFADYQMNDGRLLEIPAGGSTVSQRHLYEKGVYVVGGSGYTIFQQEGKAADRVEWGPGDLFAVPLNVRHQHFNDGDGPARLLAVTSFPLVLNVMADERFVADNPYAFDGRYDGAPDYFAAVRNDEDIMVEANYVEDIRAAGLQPYDYRGKGAETVRWQMAGNSMLSMHISEMPPRKYMKAHRHSSPPVGRHVGEEARVDPAFEGIRDAVAAQVVPQDHGLSIEPHHRLGVEAEAQGAADHAAVVARIRHEQLVGQAKRPARGIDR